MKQIAVLGPNFTCALRAISIACVKRAWVEVVTFKTLQHERRQASVQQCVGMTFHHYRLAAALPVNQGASFPVSWRDLVRNHSQECGL